MPKMSATKESLETTGPGMPGIPVLSDALADVVDAGEKFVKEEKGNAWVLYPGEQVHLHRGGGYWDSTEVWRGENLARRQRQLTTCRREPVSAVEIHPELSVPWS